MADRQTHVVSDTTSYLPADLLERIGVSLVSLYVTVAGETRRESDIDDLAGFYSLLRDSGEAATTSQPSVGDFIEVYEPLLADGGEVVSLHLSAGISGTCDSARQAADRLEADGKGGERIRVFDSRSACGGLGLVVMEACKAADEGLGADAIVERAEEARRGLKIWFAVDTLEYLKRGGRIGAASAWIGTTLKIKPILTLGAEIEPVERVRTRSRAYRRMVEYARERREDGAESYAIQHIQEPDTAAELAADCERIFGRPPEFIGEVGPVIGAHVGPGLLGVGGIAPAD